MARHVAEVKVLGPWSLATSRRFWEGFTPAALAGDPAGPGLRMCSASRVTGAAPKQP